MPSGPKKRKANKKKKLKAANSHSTTNSQQVLGNYDRKTHDGKHSDSGEISPPNSEPDHLPLVEDKEQGEVDRKGKDSHISVSVVFADSKHMEVSQNGTHNGESESKQMEVQEEFQVIEVIGELKPDMDYETKDVNIESSSSSSSSSDEESRLGVKNSRVVESEKIEEEERSGGSVMETVPDVYSAGKLVEEKSANSVVDTVPDFDLARRLEEVEKKSDGSVMEAAPAVDSAEPFVSLTEEVTQASVSTTVLDARVSNEIGLSSKNKEELSVQLSKGTVGTSDVIDPTEMKNEDNTFQSSDAPIIETSGSGRVELSKEIAISESPENQPLLGSIPPPVERTSWKSCCGIFDVLRGSNS